MMGKSIQEINLGDTAEFAKTISESDIYLYAGLSGDLNPAHVNQAYAQETFFKERIAHGMLLGGFISAVIGMQLPGPGAIYIRQEMKFMAPARMGDTITAKVEVKELITEKNRIILRTSCFNQNGDIVVDGEAVISPPKKK